jgi:hypothetical protein
MVAGQRTDDVASKKRLQEAMKIQAAAKVE